MNPVGLPVPPRAWDCHMHVFGDPARYKPAAWRAYDPTPMELPEYEKAAAAIGFTRVVFVQPSAYGTDNACMLDALRARPATSRGVAVIDDATPDSALAEMDRLGVRGVRLNLVSNGAPDPDAAGATLAATARRVAPLGWHVQIFALPALLAALAPAIAASPVPVVIDHMGGMDAALGLTQPGLTDLLALLDTGHCWVKVSGANRISRQTTGFTDAIPIMRALIAANPARAVWGTDWPHIGPHEPGKPKPVIYMNHDNAALLGLLAEAVPDQATWNAVLSANPARLYGLDE